MEKIDIMAGKSSHYDRNSWLSFKVHSLDTMGIMTKLYLNWLSDATRKYISTSLISSSDIEKCEEKACDFCKFIALVHDIGKLTPAFQKKISINIENHYERLEKHGFDLQKIHDISETPHNIAGQVILEDYGFSREVAVIIGSHHGRATHDVDKQLSNYSSNYFGINSKNENEWRSIWSEWINYSLSKCNFSLDDFPKPNVKVQMLLSGLLIMSDWIASNTDYFPLMDFLSTEIDERQCKIRLQSAWKKLSLPLLWTFENESDNYELFKKRFGYNKPNAVQSTVIDIVSQMDKTGLIILEAQMGVGKTETALISSEIIAKKFGESGIFFGLPTQATANGIFGRIKNWAETQSENEKHSIRLAHGMTDFNSEYQDLFHGKASDSGDEALIVHEWFEGRKQALLADFVVATVDQFLLASLKQRHVMLRHLGLSGKVVIIDECHAYDTYMNVYLDRTLTWLGEYGVPVIVLSATLPENRREELVKAYLNNKKIKMDSINSYPILTWTNGNEVMQKAIETQSEQKKIAVKHVAESELISFLAEKISNGGCIAVVVNTVGYAQKLSNIISDALPENEVICFHSRFIATDRANIENQLLMRVGKNSKSSDRNGLIVVGTQVLEQSLDLDFDLMITELCPMDLLLQRSGRLHRHDRKRPEKLKNPELVILKPDEDKSSKIYCRWILMRTEKYLPNELVIPECVPNLVNMTYSNPMNDDENHSDEWNEYEKIQKNKKQNAKKYCINSENLLSRHRNTISDFLNDDAGNNTQAELSVRDSDEGIEVLVMQKKNDGNYYFLPWYNNGSLVDKLVTPSDEEAKLIATQRLRLPVSISKYYFNEIIQVLSVMPERWKTSYQLKSELLLLLDENLSFEFKDKILIYSRENGLELKKR